MLGRKRSERPPQRGKRTALLLLFAVAATGVLLRLIASVQVELFFEAIALFGCMALLEQGEEPAGGRPDGRLYGRATAAIALTLLAVIAMNVALILNMTSAQSDAIGNTQLDVIRSDLQDTITEAETNVLRAALGAEQLMEAGASRDQLTAYFYEQRDKYRSGDSFLNVYIPAPTGTSSPISRPRRASTPPSGSGTWARRTARGRSTSPSPTWTPTAGTCASPSPRCCPTGRRWWAWT